MAEPERALRTYQTLGAAAQIAFRGRTMILRIYTVEKSGRTGEIELTDQGQLSGLSNRPSSKSKPTHDDTTVMDWTVDTEVNGSSYAELFEAARDYIVRDWHGFIMQETTPAPPPKKKK